MTDAVPAPVALAVLGTLSVDLRSALVLDATGAVLAGDAALATPAQALLDGAGEREVRAVAHGAGRICAARSGTRTVAFLVGPHALDTLVAHDLLAALDDLGGC